MYTIASITSEPFHDTIQPNVGTFAKNSPYGQHMKVLVDSERLLSMPECYTGQDALIISEE